jgi:ABC-type thiamin/hydroxymethylpyrimidine transport system permease subunit
MSSPISVWSWRVIDIVVMIIIGIIWLIVVFLSQSNYDKGYRQKTLSKLFSMVTGYQILLFFIASMIVHLLDTVPATSQGIIMTVVQAVFTAGLLLFAYKDSFMKCLNLKS